MSPDLLAFLEELVARGFGPEEAIQLAAQAGMLAPQTSGYPDDRGSLQSMLANRQAGVNFYDIPSENPGSFFDQIEFDRMGRIIDGQPTPGAPPFPSGFDTVRTTSGVNRPGGGVLLPSVPWVNPDSMIGNATSYGSDTTGGDLFEDGTPAGYGFAGPQDKERSVARPAKDAIRQMLDGGMRGMAGRMSPDQQGAMDMSKGIVSNLRQRYPPMPPTPSPGKRPVTPPGQAKKEAGVQSARQFTPAGPKTAKPFARDEQKPVQKPRPKPGPGTRKF